MGSVEGPLAGIPVPRCGPSLGIPPGGGIWEEPEQSLCLSLGGWSAVIKVWSGVLPIQLYDPLTLPPGSSLIALYGALVSFPLGSEALM